MNFVRRVQRALLEFPLEQKVLGANLAVIVFAAFFWSQRVGGLAVLAVGCFVNYVLIRVALRPVKQIEVVADLVSRGQLEARVPKSVLADRGLARAAATFNEALDYLSEAKESVRKRGAKIVYSLERERAALARELHESVGQTLAAANFQAAATVTSSAGTEVEEHAREVVSLLHTAMDDLRRVSRELHPGLADDLGLPAALDFLARTTMQKSPVDVQLRVRNFELPVSSLAAAMLYRITQEALRGIACTAGTGVVTIELSVRDVLVFLEINEHCAPGPEGAVMAGSLAAAAEKVALLGGELQVERNLSGGNRIKAQLRRQMEAA